MGNENSTQDKHEVWKLDIDLILLARLDSEDWVEFPVNMAHCIERIPEMKKRLNSCGSNYFPKIVKFDDIDANLLNILLLYAMKKEIEVSSSEIWMLRGAAAKLKMQDLQNDIDFEVLRRLGVHNFCDIFIRYRDPKILCWCLDRLKYTTDNHAHILSSENFLKMKMDPHLRLLLQWSSLHVDGNFLHERCLEWYAHNSAKYGISTLRQINFYIELRSECAKNQFLPHGMFPIAEEYNACSRKTKENVIEHEDFPKCEANVQDSDNNLRKDIAWTEEKSRTSENSVKKSSHGVLPAINQTTRVLVKYFGPELYHQFSSSRENASFSNSEIVPLKNLPYS